MGSILAKIKIGRAIGCWNLRLQTRLLMGSWRLPNNRSLVLVAGLVRAMRVTGNGQINANAINGGGFVEPGLVVGALNIANDYTQVANGTLSIDIGGTDNSAPNSPQFDQLLTADFDNDGDVDADYLVVWESSFGVGAGTDAGADSDSNGADFLAWQQQFTGPGDRR